MNDRDLLDDFKQSIYDALKQLHDKFQALETSLETSLRNQRDSTFNAINLLSREFLEFRDTDTKERKKKQRQTLIKDIIAIAVMIFVVIVGCMVIFVLMGVVLFIVWRLGLS